MSDPIIIKSRKLQAWQKDAAKIFESLQPNERFIIKASRQKGKSEICRQFLLYTAINYPKSYSYYVSPTLAQSRLFFQALQECCEGNALVKNINASLLEITFVNKSKIFFRSCEQGEHLRGGTCKGKGLLIWDEQAYCSDDMKAILLPYTNVNKNNIICISTPRRKTGTFYEWYTRAINGEKNYRYLDVNDYDNSFFIDNDQIEEYRLTLPAEKFKNEILGLFTEMDEGVFGDYMSCYAEPTDTEPVYGGIDFSSTGSDSTIMSFFNKSHEQCYIWADNEIKDPVKRCEKMAEVLNGFPTLKKVICEKNSIGAVYIALLKRLLKNPSILEEFVTTNDSKKQIVETVVEKISKKEITLLNDKKQDYELSIFETVQLSKGNYTYAASTRVNNSHDDYVMALCLAVKGFTSNSGKYVVRGTTNPNSKLSLREKYN